MSKARVTRHNALADSPPPQELADAPILVAQIFVASSWRVKFADDLSVYNLRPFTLRKLSAHLK